METLIFTVAVLVLSVIFHEVAHGWAANALGDPTARLQGRLSLNPVRHIDPIGSIVVPAVLVLTNSGLLFGWAKPVPYNPYNLRNQRWGEAIVGIAGVAVNLLLAVVFAVATRVAVANGALDFATLAATVSLVNLSLGLFNLLPIPPLDGFTVLRGLLPYRQSLALRRVEDAIAGGGILALVAILLLFSQFLAQPFGALVRAAFRVLVGA